MLRHARQRYGFVSISLTAFAVTLTAHATPARAQAPPCARAKTALVLSGGGTRGFAHIGVLRVLDSLGVRPDLIVGSSVGAIMGGLYASGYTGSQIDSLMRALPIGEVVHAYEPRSPGVLSSIPALAVWESGGSGFRLQTGSVRENEATAIFNALMLRGNLLARGNFDRLAIPLRVVATDLTNRSPVVIGSGDLAQAVRASAAIPFIFPPIEIDGRMLFDGGVADNTPIRIARALGAERIIFSWLPAAPIDGSRLDDPMEIAAAIVRIVFATDTSALGAGDVLIRNPTDSVNTLDFTPALRQALVEHGARTAREQLAGRCLLALGESRPALAPTRVSAVSVAGTRGVERAPLAVALGLRANSHVREDSLRARLLELGRSDAFRSVWLTPTGDDSTVNFEIHNVRARRHVMLIGLAYDNDYGGRIWGGITDRRLFGLGIEGAGLLDVSKYRSALRGTVREQVSLTGRAFPLYGSFAGSHEDVRQFRDSAEFSPASTTDFVVSTGVSPRFGPLWSADLSAEYRTWSEPGHRNGPTAVGVHVMLTRSTFARRTLLSLDALVNTDFQRAALELSSPFSIGKIAFAPRLRGGWGKHLPLQQTFAFGGTDGFPGFINGERRGAQEAVASLAINRPVLGPIHVRAEVMSGAMGNGDGFLRRRADSTSGYDGRIVTGVRVGFEIRTPALDIRLERGYNDANRKEAFVRIGRWF